MTMWSMPGRPEDRAARAPGTAAGRSGVDEPGDGELARGLHAGEKAAAVAVYDRYADRLHDFCWSLLRDRTRAADATERTFVAAVNQLRHITDMEPLRPWLYAVAHRQALDLARPNGDPDGVAVEAPDPFAVGEPSEGSADQPIEREIVWRAAAGLSERDQALLTLHLRHGLEEAELGQALGVDAEQARVLVSRLSDQVERSLGALLVGGLGRRDCPELAKLLGESEARSSLLQKRVTRHVDRCETCARHRSDVEPLALLAAVPMLPAPPELRERMLGRLKSDAVRGRPFRDRLARRGARLLAAATLVLVATGVIFWSHGERPGGAPASGRPNALGAGPTRPTGALGPAASTPTSSERAASTTTRTTADPSSTTTVASPAQLAVSPEVVDLDAREQTATLTVRNAGAGTIQWRASDSAAWLAVAPSSGSLTPGGSAQVTLTADRTGLPEGQVRATAVLDAGGARQQVAVTAAVERAPSIHATASPTRIRTLSLCGDTTATVTATISDESALGGVVLEWGDPVTRTAMRPRNGTWQADVGPVDRPQTLRWRVVATDDRGNTGDFAGTVQVDSCLIVG